MANLHGLLAVWGFVLVSALLVDFDYRRRTRRAREARRVLCWVNEYGTRIPLPFVERR